MRKYVNLNGRDLVYILYILKDKALRRISELREQCQLEQKAKRHLEEELRSDLEEKEHIIKALQTKVVLLKSSGGGQILEEAVALGDFPAAAEGSSTISLNDSSQENSSNSAVVTQRDSEKVSVLEGQFKSKKDLICCWVLLARMQSFLKLQTFKFELKFLGKFLGFVAFIIPIYLSYTLNMALCMPRRIKHASI